MRREESRAEQQKVHRSRGMLQQEIHELNTLLQQQVEQEEQAQKATQAELGLRKRLTGLRRTRAPPNSHKNQ